MNLNQTQFRPVPIDSGRAQSRPVRGTGGFTAVELAAVIVMIAFIALALVPALARTEPNAKAARCQSNLRRLAAAWSVYAGDNDDRVANNFGVTEILSSVQSGGFENWVNNVMTWGASTATSDRSNTNVAWVTNGAFGRYLVGAVDILRCPSDKYLSRPQIAAGWTARLRSVSMNAVFGRFSTTTDSTANGRNWAFPQYAQYLKRSEVPKPIKTLLFIEEHPDSINDSYFINTISAASWQDIPASFHNGGCSVAFADGRAELKRWQSSTSWYPVQFSYPATRAFDNPGRADFAWYLSRVGFVDARTRQPMFGY
ncbi:MAG TPA: hypothetical protein VJA21_20140 [Verrucomicrobiae bacterium]